MKKKKITTRTGEKFVAEGRRRRSWKRFISAMSLLVVFATVSGLTLPAIALNNLVCGFEEHTHTEECYTSGTERVLSCCYELHEHNDACYDAEKNLICEKADFVVHTHDDKCYDASGDLVCMLREIEEHWHTEECYHAVEADGGHKHTDECYEMVPSAEPICGLQETSGHTHNEECYAVGGEPVCTLEENAGHTHAEGCQGEDGTLLCTLEETPGHTHGDGCFAAAGVLLCTQPEAPAHTHDESCSGNVRGSLICGREEREAVSAVRELICEKEEILLHTHEDGCYIKESELSEETDGWIMELVRQQQEEALESSDAEAVANYEAVLTADAAAEDKLYMICTEREVLEHQHDDACFTGEEPTLSCQLPEHTHTPDCENNTLLTEEEQLGVAEVIAMIDALPDLQTLEASLMVKSGEEKLAYKQQVLAQINAAFAAYNALSEKQRALVTNYTRLADYAYLVTEDTAVKEVLGQIGGLPTIAEFEEKYASLSSIQKPVYVEELLAQIAAVNTLYEALTEEQQGLVLNYGKVTGLAAHLQALTGKQGELSFVAVDYTTQVIATPEAKLPEDTVITARPVTDFGTFSLSGTTLTSALRSASADASLSPGASYMETIREAIPWGEVTDARLFDITLTSHGDEVQPAAPVQVRTEFAEPIALSGEELIYGVHFGASGVDILPAAAERDENGNITAITHTQSSFSVTGYVFVLEHDKNANDIGPDVLPVHYCIWVNDQWTIAGSTRTGWYGDYNVQDKWPPAEGSRDYITMDQLVSVLKPYGLDVDHTDGLSEEELATLSSTVWYQRAENDGMTIRHDSTPIQKSINGTDTWVFRLSGNKVKDSGYHIYYVPGGTESGAETIPDKTYASNKLLGQDLKAESKFFTVTVRDRQGLVYDDTTPEKGQDRIPATRVLRYGERVDITVVANMENGVNLGWQWVNDKGAAVNGLNPVLNGELDSRFTYKDNGDCTETYSFSGILGRTTLIPFANSVEGAEIDPNRKVDVAVFLDDRWQKVGRIELMYKKEDACVDANGEPLWFITAGQAYSVLKDFGFDPDYSPDDEANKGHVFTHAIGEFSEDMTMHADGVNENIGGTGVAIGFGHEKMTIDGQEVEPKNFTLFYVPGSANEQYSDVHGVNSKTYGESALIQGDRFYSITVRDDYMLVYYGYETDNFKAYVPEGGTATVKVENAENVLWSVRNWTENIIAVPEGNFNVYTFTNIDRPISIEASYLNPSFTVQYFADIERYQLYEATGDGRIPLIDTRDVGLPTNKIGNSMAYLQVEKGTTTVKPNPNGDASPVYTVKTNGGKLERFYTDSTFHFDNAYQWKNIDKLRDNRNYVVEEIWILKDGMDPEETLNRDQWWIYRSNNDGGNITFTNRASEETAPKDPNAVDGIQAEGNWTILITEGMIMRLHYKLAEDKDFQLPNVHFYDYDISDGKGNSGQKGINSFNTSGTIQNVYAFGNSNCYTGTGRATWNDFYINQFNRTSDRKTLVDMGCSFGLVQTIDRHNMITWGNGLKGPELFGGTEPIGRTDYTGSLTFTKKGDVYTLTGSSAAGTTRTRLDEFFHPSPCSGTRHDKIYTNNFWALDNAPEANRKDKNWGAYKDEGTTAGYHDGYTSKNDNVWEDDLRGYSVSSKKFPESDDGQNHNWFFGMSFGVGFDITSDYVGPMEYIFFGDDDMWVFLDEDTNDDGVLDKTTKICDIGGVHSAVGQYVNLRDYVPEGSEGHYELRFYYTERGASGSTCWMSFTLPAVTTVILEEGTSEISLTKAVVNPQGNAITRDDQFAFSVNLYTNQDKKEIINTPFSVRVEKADGTVQHFPTQSGSVIHIGGGDTALIRGVPVGAWYVIQEHIDPYYEVEIKNKEGEVKKNRTAEGEVEVVPTENLAAFTNIYIGYELPNTGGTGTFLYLICGWTLITLAVLAYLWGRRRAR